MNKNDEGSEPPPTKEEINGYQEPEDWDMPTTIFEEDDSPEILEDVEPEEAIGTLFSNLHLTTFISLILGVVFMIAFYVIGAVMKDALEHSVAWGLVYMIIGFVAGVLIVFGAAELIIMGVKGIQDKMNWNPYLTGIIQAVGAALAELVVVIILLVNSKTHNNEDLATTAIVLILTGVIINIFFLGISMIYVSRKEPFDLPKELTFYETNLIQGMVVFSFVVMIYGFYFEFKSAQNPTTESLTYQTPFEIIIGIALILVYFFFIFLLIRRLGKKTSTPQTLISEFFPDEDDVIVVDSETPPQQLRLIEIDSENGNGNISAGSSEKPDSSKKKDRNNRGEEHAFDTMRRWPWTIIIALFLFGVGGIITGGFMLASAIEQGLETFELIFNEVPVLAYAVVVGIVSSSPELVVTFRGLLSKDKELQEVGLVHQVSAINQTFYILFGVPFLLSGLFAIGIPITLEVTLVTGGIFVMSLIVQTMIADDNKFDLLEGVVVTVMSIVSLLFLVFIGSNW